MNAFEINIFNPMGQKTWTERFNDEESMKAWIKNEQSKKYWLVENKIEVIDNREKIAEQTKIAEAARAVEEKKKSEARKLFKVFRKIKEPTASDCAKAILKILDYLDPEETQEAK